MVKLARLKSVRQRKALTQQQLAEKASVSRVTVSRLEGGRDEAFPTTVRKLAAALGVEPEDLSEAASRHDGDPRAKLAQVSDALAHSRLVVPDRQRATRFLREQAELASIVTEAADQLVKLIPDACLKLEVLPDPDYGEAEQLFLGVSTSLNDADALEALGRFDREWWVHHAPRTGGLLCIDLSDE